MSLTFSSIAKELGRALLFVATWLIATLGSALIFSCFCGAVLMVLVGFGVHVPDPEIVAENMPGFMWAVLLVIGVLAVLVGCDFSFKLVAFTRHGDQKKFESGGFLMALVAWSALVTMYMFVSTFAILVGTDVLLDLPDSADGAMPIAAEKARYIVLAAFLMCCYIAYDQVKIALKKENE